MDGMLLHLMTDVIYLMNNMVYPIPILIRPQFISTIWTYKPHTFQQYTFFITLNIKLQVTVMKQTTNRRGLSLSRNIPKNNTQSPTQKPFSHSTTFIDKILPNNTRNQQIFIQKVSNKQLQSTLLKNSPQSTYVLNNKSDSFLPDPNSLKQIDSKQNHLVTKKLSNGDQHCRTQQSFENQKARMHDLIKKITGDLHLINIQAENIGQNIQNITHDHKLKMTVLCKRKEALKNKIKNSQQSQSQSRTKQKIIHQKLQVGQINEINRMMDCLLREIDQTFSG